MKKQIKTILTSLGLPPSKIRRTLFGFQRYFDENELVSDFLLKKLDNGVAIDVGVAWGSVSFINIIRANHESISNFVASTIKTSNSYQSSDKSLFFEILLLTSHKIFE